MKRLLSIVVAYIALAYAPGEAQHEDFHRWFADTGRARLFQLALTSHGPCPIQQR